MIDVVNLSKKYGDFLVLDNWSWHVDTGQKIFIFSPSGSGKTTLFRILLGLDKKYKGTIKISTESLAVVFQETRLFPYKTVLENILYPLKFKEKSKAASLSHPLLEEWLLITGLQDFTTSYPYELSGGMKQKVAIIRAFLSNSALIFLDEPFKSLDPASKKRICNFINCKYGETTLIINSHNAEELKLIDNAIAFEPIFKTPL